jgi:proline dehydrogenase
MMRSFFISLSKANWAKNRIMRWGFAWRAASRFIAGETIEEALQAARVLNQKGLRVTLDYLGEKTVDEISAYKSTEDILLLLDQIEKESIKANVSIKLSQVGLNLNDAICFNNLSKIVERAQFYGNFIRVDMEESAVTEKTIQMVEKIRASGYPPERIGIVMQAYLFRTPQDVERLTQQGIPIRLCKGAYQEAAEVAYPKKLDVDKAYDQLAFQLLNASRSHEYPSASQDGRRPPLVAFATHDEVRINTIKSEIRLQDFPTQAFEFQMLYGIRRDLQEQLVREGYAVRVYVPYGTQWYPYFMRRLAERPANVWFFISNFFR